MKEASKRNPGIDIIRGLCILAVILLHLNIHFGFTDSFLKELLPKQIFSLLFWSGFYGVVIFFTLSGYLITTSILTKWNALHHIDLKTFYWFRFARIIPPLVALLILLSVLHLTRVEGFVIDQAQTSLSRAIFSALTFHINWLEIQIGYLPASWDILWSISIEETFYLVFPMVCLLIRKEWHFVIVLTLFLFISPWARTSLYPGNELGDRNHLAYIDSLALGCMAAMIAAKYKFPGWLNRSFVLVGISLLTLVMVFRSVVYQSGIVDLGLNITILSTGIALILLWLHQRNNTEGKTHWSLNWLRQTGLYSYEIYLTHMFVVIAGATLFRYYQFGSDWLVPFSLSIIIISYLLGRLTFHCFSEPLNLWLRKQWKSSLKFRSS